MVFFFDQSDATSVTFFFFKFVEITELDKWRLKTEKVLRKNTLQLYCEELASPWRMEA